MVKEAPREVLAWMQPKNFDGQEAAFLNPHILIAGRKGNGDD
jgi:hypothetical protein